MQNLLLIAAVVLTSSQYIFQKQYNIKAEKANMYLFSVITSLSALAFFVLGSGFKLDFSVAILPYSFAFGVAYAAGTLGLASAICFGPLAITSLIMSYSLIIPTSYGIFFLKEPVGINAYIGIALLLVSLLLLNLKKEKVQFSVKWMIFLVIGFVGNGMCSTIQKMQQLNFEGAYKNEFMIAAIAAAVLVLVIPALKQGGIKGEIGKCLVFAAPNGIVNGTVNLLVMILTGLIPNVILFPVISAGGIVLSCFSAVIFYKEKLTKVQIIGYIMGISSVILLNL